MVHKEHSIYKLDIILPVYNSGKYIFEALNSIVNSDDFLNYRLIVIDDGSTDNSSDIINEISGRYNNISVFSRNNKGLVFTLNEAISYCSAQYVARMDADDVVAKERFRRQLEFLEANPDVAVVGTDFNLIDEDGCFIRKVKVPKGTSKIKSYSLFGSPLCHPSVMFRGSLFYEDDIRYNDDILCEDYCLWLRIMSRFKIQNINYSGLNYRITSTGLSKSNVLMQLENSIEFRDLQLLFPVEKSDYEFFNNIFSPVNNKSNVIYYVKSLMVVSKYIIRSDASFLWFLIYGVKGIVDKVRVNF
jgi:glycosyltransferase involved in cell wall biosynthesis